MTWNVDTVLSFIRGLPDNDSLSFQQLSHKLAMLLALANVDRCSDLAALDLSHRSYVTNGVRFIIPSLTKSRRSGPPIEAFYPLFPEDQCLCPVQTLRAYEERSRSAHTVGEENSLYQLGGPFIL